MISNDYSTEEKSFHHNTGTKGGKVNEESTPHQMTIQTLIMEVKQLQILQSDAIKAQEEAKQALEKAFSGHQQLKLHLEQNKTLSDSLQRQLETLHAERAALLSNASNIRESCGRCHPGWLLLNTSCYFHAKVGLSSLKNWSDSRADCISRGADLAVIDNWDEQLNLFETLPKVERTGRPWWFEAPGIWIGLTDIQKEGTWVWVNNVTLQHGGYWIQGEPNNYGSYGENCAALMIRDNPRKSWFDGQCDVTKEWLCEMGPN
uniref:C-type lectin domain family 4 member E-like n=1 Tax=Monopterus albus TaxID=43700 RepID=UPI0009B4D006|nr:C-type lectin domain family 4 member E-like [Monopterus albus]